MNVLDFAFMRRSKSRRGLTSFSRQSISGQRGRPSELTDAELHNRRDQLVQISEGYWAEIAWELQTCKKADDLIRIFTPIADPRSWVRDVVIIFCLPSSEPGSGATLRKVRSELRGLAELLYRANESKRITEEQLHQVNMALEHARGSSRRIVKRARKKRRKEAWKAAREYRPLSEKERRLRARLRDLETSFARQELFRFLKSKRYSLTPIGLANAAAGLPYMGWRQSMRRSTKAPSKNENGTRYQIFKAIRYLVATANKKTEHALVASFRDSVRQLPSRYRGPKAELAEKWWYLERAIRQAYRTKLHPRELHREITKGYFKLVQQPQSQVDMVLAEQAKLSLSKQPERIPSNHVKPDTTEDGHVKIMKARM